MLQRAGAGSRHKIGKRAGDGREEGGTTTRLVVNLNLQIQTSNLKQRTLDKAKAAVDKIEACVANDSEDSIAANALLKSLKLTPMECDLAYLPTSPPSKILPGNSVGKRPFDAQRLLLQRETGAEHGPRGRGADQAGVRADGRDQPPRPLLPPPPARALDQQGRRKGSDGVQRARP